MSVPIGSIIAFAGYINPSDPLLPISLFENNMGWLLCNGRELDRTDPDFVDLFNAIGVSWGGGPSPNIFRIPDLRGYFLRGVSYEVGNPPRNPLSTGRFSLYPEGNSGDNVGSYEGFATHAPVNFPFFTDGRGDHVHLMDLEVNAGRDVSSEQENTVAYPWISSSPSINTISAGYHSHLLEGGDPETRPINAYVNWIIRYRVIPTDGG
jgi:Phage Tail Collar Domain